MSSVKSWAIRSALIAVLAVSSATCSTPSTPTPPPPPPPPPAAPPTLSCEEGISRATINASGVAVSYETPKVSGGEGTVNVTCSPPSGETFPIGMTPVQCTATDSLGRTGTCAFGVTVSKLAQLSKTKYLAFGDSITAGEITFPGSTASTPGTSSKLVIVPGASYPAVLERTLLGRYSTQAQQISVANYGLGGEKTINARARFFDALNTVRPEVVLLWHGHNDIPGGLDGAASGAASEMRIMAAEARLRGMRVFLATMLPPRPGGNRTIAQVFIDDYNNRMRALAASEGAVLVDIYNALRPEVTRYIGVDGLHPNEAGYVKIADVFFQAIQANFEVR
jgi:lysophospholipase L1-like esterase